MQGVQRMPETAITFGDTMAPPLIDISVSGEVYDLVKTDEFDAGVVNGLLLALLTYLNDYGIELDDTTLPWAEEMIEQ